MKKALALVSVAGLMGAAGFVAWSVFSRPEDTIITADAVKSFDLESAPAVAAARTPAAEELRDAVASPVSPRPIALAEMTPAAVPAAAPVAVRPFLTPKLEKAARSSRLFGALLSAPGRLMGSGTALRSPRDLRAFLTDKASVDSYLDSVLVRVVLNSPAAAKALLGSPTVVRAFLATPAMQDPAAVKALLGSRMLVKILDCPGIQGALSDPAVIRDLASPQTAEFLAKNPGALSAIAGAAPDLARALTR